MNPTRIGLISLVVVLTTQTVTFADEAPSLSEFEKFFQMRSALPAYPLHALIAQLNEGDAQLDETVETSQPLHGFQLFIPDGRSLQKKKADFKDPRTIVHYTSFSSQKGHSEAIHGKRTQDFELGFLGPPSLYIGHASQGQQLEVISWNPTLRQYDFLLVENYGQDKAPRIMKADRQLCLSCHQAGGPIFSRANWSEAGQLNRSLDERIITANGGNSSVVKPDALFSSFVVSFDSFVRLSNRYEQASKACRDVCHGDIECRRLILKTAMLRQSILGKTYGSRWPRASAHKKALQKSLAKHWPKGGFGYPSSVLIDRIPAADGTQGAQSAHLQVVDRAKLRKSVESFAGRPHEIHSFDEEIRRGINPEYNETISASVPGIDGQKQTLTPADSDPSINPLHPRPIVSKVLPADAADYIIEMGSRCMGLYPTDFKELSRYKPQQIDRALSAPRAAAMLEAWPPSRERAMAATLAILDNRPVPTAKHPCPEPQAATTGETKPLTPGAADTTETVLQVTSRLSPALSHYREFCIRCHEGKGAVKALSIRNLADLIKYVDANGRTLEDQIRSGDMPFDQDEWSQSRKNAWESARKEMLEELSPTR